MKLAFKPVITRRMTVHGNEAFEAALKASDRLSVIETPTTITFKFKKRRRPARASTAAPQSTRDGRSRRRRRDGSAVDPDLVQIQGGPPHA